MTRDEVRKKVVQKLGAVFFETGVTNCFCLQVILLKQWDSDGWLHGGE